jgi:hypothetical protein
MTLDARRSRDRKRTALLMVMLDGKPVPHCYYADGRRGVVREFARDAAGKLQMRDGHLVTLERRGCVKWRRFKTREATRFAYRLARLYESLAAQEAA